MDRLLAPTRPFNTILRPGDGKVPDRIAYVLCTGSRDETVGNPLCSRFCCMYSIKQNQLLMGALPLADVTVHYMDIRAPGKRYDEFYEQAKAMGANYVKGRVADIKEQPNGDLVLRYEDIENGGGIVEAEYDLVVLAVGVQPNRDAEQLFEVGELSLDEWNYVAEPEEDLNPGQTNIPGVYVAGAASGAKDIADSILHAGAAVAQVAAHLERAKIEAHARSRWCRHDRAAQRATPPRPGGPDARRRRSGCTSATAAATSPTTSTWTRSSRTSPTRATSWSQDRDVRLLGRDPAGHGRGHRGAGSWTAWSSRRARRSSTRTRSGGSRRGPGSTRTSTRRSTSASSAPGCTPTTTRARRRRRPTSSGRHRPHAPHDATRAARRRDAAPHAGHRRRHRRPARGGRPGGHRARGDAGRARADARRLGGPVRPDVPARPRGRNSSRPSSPRSASGRRSRSSPAPRWSPSRAASATTRSRSGSAARAPGRSRSRSGRSSSRPASTATSRRRASSGTASTAWSPCRSSRSSWTLDRIARLARPAGAQHRLRLLRRQPPAPPRRANQYCSRFCCAATVQAAVQVSGLDPSIRQFHLYRDMRTYGKFEPLYTEARDAGSVFLKFAARPRRRWQRRADGRLTVTVARPAHRERGARHPGRPGRARDGHGPAQERGAGRRPQAPGRHGRLLQRDPPEAPPGRDRRRRGPDRRRLPGSEDLGRERRVGARGGYPERRGAQEGVHGARPAGRDRRRGRLHRVRDCLTACPYDAISMGEEGGRPRPSSARRAARAAAGASRCVPRTPSTCSATPMRRSPR